MKKILISFTYNVLIMIIGLIQVIIILVSSIWIPSNLNYQIIRILTEGAVLFWSCTIIASVVIEYYFCSPLRIRSKNSRVRLICIDTRDVFVSFRCSLF